MAKWQFTRTGQPRQYPTLGFTASFGDVIEADAAPDSWWDEVDESTPVTIPVVPTAGTVEDPDGALLVYNAATNRYEGRSPAAAGVLTEASADARIAAAGLSRWRAALGADPAAAKIAIVGDSTAEETNYPFYYSRLRTYHMQDGQLLGGMTTTNLVEGGNSGLALEAWLTGAVGDFKPADLWAAAPDLIVYKWGTNDVRLGATTQAQMLTRLRSLVDLTRANLPDADVVLAVPPTFTTTVVGTDFLGGATAAQAQDRADALRNAYLAMRDYSPNVIVWDAAADLWGTVVNPTSPLMTDQLHNNQRGQERWSDALAALIGTQRKRVESIAANAYRWSVVGRIVAAGNGYIDITALDDTMPAGKEWPLTTSDVLHVPGYASSPIALTSATFSASGNNVRILKTGDWSGIAANTLVALVGSHGKEGVSEGRIQVTVDPGSIAAGGTVDTTVTVTGATTDCGVIVQPHTGAMISGLHMTAWVSAANTVTVRLYNSTGASIDPPSGTWKFWLAR